MDADVQLAAAYVSLEHQQGWEYALSESCASVLKSRGLADALQHQAGGGGRLVRRLRGVHPVDPAGERPHAVAVAPEEVVPRVGEPEPRQVLEHRAELVHREHLGREGAVRSGRQAAGHHAGIEAGGDRRHLLRHERLDQPGAAAERRHRGERRRSGHAGGPAHDYDATVVPLARVAPPGRQGREVGWWHHGTLLLLPSHRGGRSIATGGRIVGGISGGRLVTLTEPISRGYPRRHFPGWQSKDSSSDPKETGAPP